MAKAFGAHDNGVCSPLGWTGYRGVTHFHTHLDVPDVVGCRDPRKAFIR